MYTVHYTLYIVHKPDAHQSNATYDNQNEAVAMGYDLICMLISRLSLSLSPTRSLSLYLPLPLALSLYLPLPLALTIQLHLPSSPSILFPSPSPLPIPLPLHLIINLTIYLPFLHLIFSIPLPPFISHSHPWISW